MLIKGYRGYELEKEKSNTSEDFFNRSEITFEDDGKEKTLHVLYVRYFDELFSEFTPFEVQPLFKAGAKDIYLKDIVALICLIKDPGLRHRKRIYINSQAEFASYFKDIDFSKLHTIFEELEAGRGYHLRSAVEFITQP